MRAKRLVPGRRAMVTGAIGLVLGLAIAGGTWWFVNERASAEVATPTSITRTATAAVDTIQKTISTSGTLTPAVQKDVSFVASGIVTKVSVSSGQAVSAGQALATVDTLTMQQTLADAKLSLARAQATLVTDQDALGTAQDALTSAQDAGDDTTAEEAAVTSAEQQVNVDRTSITTAQTNVDTAQKALKSATLTSPIDGVVSEVNVAVGDKITGTASGTDTSTGGTGSTSGTDATAGSPTGSSGGANSNPSTDTGATSGSSTSSAAFVIVGTGSWKVDVTVDSAQIGLVAIGDQAKLTTDGSTEPMFGTINSVGLISTSTSSTASYPIEVAVTGSPSGLHDGESVTVSLVYEQLSNVLTVPSAAIQVENGQSVVNRVDGDQQVSTVVQTGETDGTNTEITAGLNEGDQVSVTVTLGGAGRTGTGQGFPGGGELPAGGFPGGEGFPGGAPPTGGFVGGPQGAGGG